MEREPDEVSAMDDVELESEINKELRKWQNLGIHPKQWSPDLGYLSLMVRIDVLTEILERADIIVPDFANRLTMEHTMRRLKYVREINEEAIVKARQDAIRASGGQIIVPNGFKDNLH